MTEQHYIQAQPVRIITNGYATASLVLGIVGFVLMGIPLIGFVIGGIPDLLAVIFGIVGFNQARRIGVGRAASNWGTALGILSLLSMFLGAGTLW